MVVEGEFVALVDLARVGQLHVRLGDALDGDRLTVTETGETILQLGCFAISLAFDLVPGGLRLLRITPFGVASAKKGEIVFGEVFTINDCTPRVTSIGESVGCDENALASAGEMTLYSGPVDGPHPDFTTDGGELAFAYIRSNSKTSEVSAITNIHGIDDFEVVIVKE